MAGEFGLGVGDSAGVVWTSSGIALAAFLIMGNRVWAGIFIAACLLQFTEGGVNVAGLVVAAANTGEGFIGAYLLRKYANGASIFDRANDVFRFTILAAMFSTFMSATIGVTALAAGGFAEWAGYGERWLHWWLSHAVGDLIVAPVILLWCAGWKRDGRRRFESFSLVFLLFSVELLVFGATIPLGVMRYPLSFLCAPILIWSAFRLDQAEISASNLIVSAIAIWGTIHGTGPFVRPTSAESVLLTQVFLGITAIMALAVSALVSERRNLIAELRDTLGRVRTLSGLLPICAWCKKIRNDEGYWQEVEGYIYEHSEAAFSHGICPECETRYREEYRKKSAISSRQSAAEAE